MFARFVDAGKQGISGENRERTVILYDTPRAAIVDRFYASKNLLALFTLASTPCFVEPFLRSGIDNGCFVPTIETYHDNIVS